MIRITADQARLESNKVEIEAKTRPYLDPTYRDIRTAIAAGKRSCIVRHPFLSETKLYTTVKSILLQDGYRIDDWPGNDNFWTVSW